MTHADEVTPTGDSAKRSVLFIQTADNPILGADAWVLLRIIEGLDRRAHDVHVACRRSVGRRQTPVWTELSGVGGVHVVECNLGPEISTTGGVDKLRAVVRTIPALLTLGRLGVRIRRRGVEIVHAGDRPRDALAAVLLGRITGAVSVIHVHQVYSQWWTRLLRWAVHRADVVVPVSEFVAASLVSGGVDPTRVRPVLNAVDPDRWMPGEGRRLVRAELGLGDDVPVVLTACRLFPAKGVADLITAFAAARRRIPDAHLVIAGHDLRPDGAYLAELRQLAIELGVEGEVHFLGRRGDVQHLMAAADVFALPSRDEPFGLVYLEAMSMELPVIGPAHGGAREIVRHGETGLLSSPDDLEALEANIVTLLEDPALRSEMGRRGRQRVEACFTIRRQCEVMAGVYRSARGSG